MSNLSYAKRLKVGTVIVKDNRIISMGYNGTPAGWDNNCEDELFSYDERDTYFEKDEWNFIPERKGYTRLKTKQEIIHSEMNALFKLARSHESGEGAVMFCTHSPCIECSKGIYAAGISHFYYSHNYRSNVGVDFLKKCGIGVDKVGV